MKEGFKSTVTVRIPTIKPLGNGGWETRMVFEKREVPYDEEQTWVHIKFKSMAELAQEYKNDLYFDGRGRLRIKTPFNYDLITLEPRWFFLLGQVVSFDQNARTMPYTDIIIKEKYLKLPEGV